MGKRHRNIKSGSKGSLKDLQPGQLVWHESEKFTDVANAFRMQVGQLLVSCSGSVEGLKRLDVRQLLSVRSFLLGPAAEYLDRRGIQFIPWQELTWRIAEANDAFQAECLKVAERWRRDYSESEVLVSIEKPRLV